MALAAQALDAQKARKPLEQGGALEQVGARMKRVMGLTNKVSRPPKEGRLERQVRPSANRKLTLKLEMLVQRTSIFEH